MMIKLSGILEYSMGNFLCLRGFSSYKELSRVSKENEAVQRKLIEEHKGEMATFLNKGEYRFFPEVILSTYLSKDTNYDEINDFLIGLQERRGWNNKTVGNFTVSISNRKTEKRERIATICFDESKIKLNRIDGNHRLSASNDVINDFVVPFCLIFCFDKSEESKYSRAIFHNINAKQIPLELEHNLKVIIEGKETFLDNDLKTDPSFGYNYYLTRKMIDTTEFGYFSTINSYIEESKYTFFVELFSYLLDKRLIEENEDAVTKIQEQLSEIESALKESEIKATTTNIAVIGALAYYKLTDDFKYRGFLSWVKKNNIGNVKNLHIDDVINLYDEIYKGVPKKAFLARWYPSAEDGDDIVRKAESRIKAMKELAEEMNLELVDLGTQETGTFDIRNKMYSDIRECDIFIADVSGARHNVMIEIGYALKHVDTGRMVFYFQETDKCKSVPFDVNHLAYDKIVDSSEIKTKTKARIETILEQAKNGEI